MKIYVQMKAAGKRRPILEKVAYEISDNVQTVKDFIREVVSVEVEKYNTQDTNVETLSFLTDEEIRSHAETGKVGFGRIYSEKKADLPEAIENAIQCYEDGIVRIFQNEMEIEGTEKEITIQEEDVFTFIRLVFLAGRMW